MDINLLVTGIYLIGYFTNYYLFRYWFKSDGLSWEWDDVIKAGILSISSWVGVVVTLSFLIPRPKGKPPRWL